MTLDIARIVNREIMDLQIFDYKTKLPIMTMDYATSAQTENAGDVVYAVGGSGNPRRASFIGDKTTTVTIETQIYTMEHLALLAGEEITKGATAIYKSEVLTVEDGGSGAKVVNLKKTPIGTAANIAVFSYVNGIKRDSQPVASIDAKEVTLAAGATVAIGDEVEVYYRWSATNSKKLSFTAKGMPKTVFLVGDTVYTEEISTEIVGAQMVYYKAKLQPNFTITNSPTGDPGSLTLVFDLFPEKVNGVDTQWTMIVYEDTDLPN